jgi:acyl-CoA thioester hydrolase
MESPHFRIASEVAFADTDASGWMHFSNIFRHVERAEHAFLLTRGVDVYDFTEIGWPRVHVECDYKLPLLPGDRIVVEIAISKIGNSSITWIFEVIHATKGVVATGNMTTVRIDANGRPCEFAEAERFVLLKKDPEGEA